MLVIVLMWTVALVVVPVTSVAPAAAAVPSYSSLPQPRGPFRVLQMNLCLSGYASCFSQTAYPAVLDEAVEEVGDHRVDALTLNEVCSTDSAGLARRTGLHLRFSAIVVAGAPLPCVSPGRRGVFGLAVLTRAAIKDTQNHAFARHDGQEQRRWLCVTTVKAVTVCTAHLGTRGSTAERQANDAECDELRGVLQRYDRLRATVFGGDINRRESCAPDTMWSLHDTKASQNPGIQHVYGSRSLMQPRPHVAATTHTDHDFFSAVGTPTESDSSAPSLS
jgi:endonuclease/exonuclease/phosphatase family metal-dependent hydrolase